MRLDRFFVKIGLRLIRGENLDPVGALGGFGWSEDGHAIGTRLLGGAALGIEADDDFVSTVAEVLRLRVSLGTVAEDGYRFALEGFGLRIVLIENFGH